MRSATFTKTKSRMAICRKQTDSASTPKPIQWGSHGILEQTAQRQTWRKIFIPDKGWIATMALYFWCLVQIRFHGKEGVSSPEVPIWCSSKETAFCIGVPHCNWMLNPLHKKAQKVKCRWVPFNPNMQNPISWLIRSPKWKLHVDLSCSYQSAH